MRRLNFSAALALALIAAPCLPAEDWPGWLGPRRDGTSTETIAPWETAPTVLWRAAVAEAHSSPVVAGGLVALHTRVPGQNAENLTARDARTGKVVWSVESPRDPFENSFGAGPRATPAISGNRIVSYGVTGVLVCRDLKTGKELWKADTLKQFAATNLYFGVSSSPIIDGDHVFVMVGGKQAGLVCFSMADGTVVWKAVDERASYSSPVLAGEGANRRLIALTQAGVVALDPATGKLDWRYPLVDRLNESSTTPIILKNSLMAASVTYGAVGLKPASGKPEVIWKNGALTCYFSTPVPTASGSEILLVSGRLLPPPSSILRCVDSATGKELWNQPAVGKYHAALMRLADGRFLMHDDTGNIRLFEATRSEFRELAKSRICGPTWAHPALSQGVLYIRDDKELLALQVRQP